ncbi:MAG: hypothetical protein AAF721_19360 [Myxococcota bacterium]
MMRTPQDLARAVAALMLLAPASCTEAPEEPGDARAGEDLLGLEVVVARAFPTGDATLSSPYSVTIDPCQTSFHVAFDPDVADDLQSDYRDSSAPSLSFSNGEDEVRFEDGTLLLESVSFALDAETLARMAPGIWSAEVTVDDEVIAQIPEVAKLATGDANRDGIVDTSDMVEVFSAGLYETGEPGGYDAGDFNCDGEVSSADLVALHQAKEGVVYESGRYMAPAATNGEDGDERRYIVSDYRCWLASYATPQEVMTSEPDLDRNPGEDDEEYEERLKRHREHFTYSDMKVERECSAAAYDPDHGSNEDSVDSVFVDPRVASHVSAECAFGDYLFEDASESLGEIGEAYQWGEGKLTAKGNVMNDVWLVCEPLYQEVTTRKSDNGTFEIDVPRMEDDDVCSVELSASARGQVNAAAEGDWAEAPGFIQPDVAVKATAKSTMKLFFPDLGDVSKNDGGTPGGRVIVGTASAESPGTPSWGDLDTLKCEIGFFGAPTWWDPFADAKTSVNCFWEVTAKDVLDFVTGGDPNPTVYDQREALARTHLGWAKPDSEGEPDYARAITDRGTLKLIPTKDGPFEKNLGKIRVYAEQEAVSNSHASHLQYDEYEILASKAYSSGNTGTVSLSLDVFYPEPPDDYDDMTIEEQQAWEEDNYQHCHIPRVSRTYDDAEPTHNEPDQNSDKIVARGRTVSVGVGDFDRRYSIFRDGTIESLWDLFGAW